eukprot:2620832-Rhodomonas_salina.1
MVLFLELVFHPVARGISLFSLGIIMSFFGVCIPLPAHPFDTGFHARVSVAPPSEASPESPWLR